MDERGTSRDEERETRDEGCDGIGRDEGRDGTRWNGVEPAGRLAVQADVHGRHTCRPLLLPLALGEDDWDRHRGDDIEPGFAPVHLLDHPLELEVAMLVGREQLDLVVNGHEHGDGAHEGFDVEVVLVAHLLGAVERLLVCVLVWNEPAPTGVVARPAGVRHPFVVENGFADVVSAGTDHFAFPRPSEFGEGRKKWVLLRWQVVCDQFPARKQREPVNKQMFFPLQNEEVEATCSSTGFLVMNAES